MAHRTDRIERRGSRVRGRVLLACFGWAMMVPSWMVAGEAAVGRVADRAELEKPLAVTAFIDVNVIPMDRERVLCGQTVLVRGATILAVGPSDEVEVPRHAVQIDGSGRYLLPGLAEMHAHVPPREIPWEEFEEVLFLYLANGITTARGMLGHPLHLELRRRLAAGEMLGPRLFTSGPSLNGQSAPDPQTAREMVRAQREAGYDFLKLHPGLGRETFDALVETAREVGIPFAGHVSADVGLPRTLEVSQASVDHLDGYLETLVADGSDVEGLQPSFFGFHLVSHLDPAKIPGIAAATREAGVWNVPTQSLIEHVLSPDLSVEELAARPEMRYVAPETVEQWSRVKSNFLANPGYDPERARRFIEVRRSLIGALQEAGAGLLLGSDAPQIFNVPGFAIHHEMRMMQASGLTPYEVLLSGTRNVALFFGEEDRMGTVEVGKSADLLLVEGNPLEDLGHLRSPAGVMARGFWLSGDDIRTGLEEIADRHAR